MLWRFIDASDSQSSQPPIVQDILKQNADLWLEVLSELKTGLIFVLYFCEP
jgi:hypothetical protein